jgi:O-antigen ligase
VILASKLSSISGHSTIKAVETHNNQNVKSQFSDKWRDSLAKLALCFFGIALWHKGLGYYSYPLLISAWILDINFYKLKETIKEPLVMAIIFFCLVLGVGVLWSDYPDSGYIRWNKYFAFLFIIPFMSLLNKERLLWAIGGLAIGYLNILILGIYHWIILGEQGIPFLKMTYLRFSLTVGTGVILAIYFGSISKDNKIKLLLWFLAGLLLFVQFNQDGRGPLLTTILTSTLLIFMLFKTRISILLGIMISMIIVVLVFFHTSDRFQQRLAQAQNDIEFLQHEKYDTDLGYRLAIWDVGLYAFTHRPMFGYGTGMALDTYEKYVETYKDGRYKSLWRDPRFHYHNDWVEIGVFVGMLGISAFIFFLWGWYQSLKKCGLPTFGIVMVCYVFLAGMTDIFLAYTGLPLLLIAISAVLIRRQKEFFSICEKIDEPNKNAIN